jgi:hypothetical protein
MATRQKMVTALFRNRLDADAAWKWLVSRGYTPSEINVMMSEGTKLHYEDGKHEEMAASTHVAEGMAAGGAIGTAVGAAAAAVAAIGTTLIVPGLGLAVAGPIAAALAGGGAGAVAGGIVGGLVGMGVPESNAKAYEEVLRDGGVAIGVVIHKNDDVNIIKNQFQVLHGENVVVSV